MRLLARQRGRVCGRRGCRGCGSVVAVRRLACELGGIGRGGTAWRCRVCALAIGSLKRVGHIEFVSTCVGVRGGCGCNGGVVRLGNADDVRRGEKEGEEDEVRLLYACANESEIIESKCVAT